MIEDEPMSQRSWVLAAVILGLLGCAHTPLIRPQAEDDERDKDLAVRTIGDVTEVANTEPIFVTGVGLVEGLEGTGGGTPPGNYRALLEDQLRREKVEGVKALLASPNNAVVVVSGYIPAGARKLDRIDLDISVPPGSKVTSLRGGYLRECVLRNYDSTKNLDPNYGGGDRVLRGHVLAKAKGPVLVGFGDGDEAATLRHGRIWGGALCLLDRPFFLVLKNDQKFARVANAIAERINASFQDDAKKRLLVLNQVTTQINEKFQTPNLGSSTETAKAMNKEIVHVRVPWEYRHNPGRYLRVVRLIPLRDGPDVRGPYKRKLEERLLNPAHTITAALRLEALGRDSIPSLKRGLTHADPMVRFASAEALAYLGSPVGAEELARLADGHDRLRAFCLAALASLDEMACQERLAELMSSPSAETRYGAFRALHCTNERDPVVKGTLFNDSFWLHHVAPNSPSMVHLSSTHRAEVVIFGDEPLVVPEIKILAGPEFAVTADVGDTKCTVTRFVTHSGGIVRRQCSLKLNDVLQTMADLGAQYPDVVDFLRQAGNQKCLSCPVRVDALPQAVSVQDLALHGIHDPDGGRDSAEQREALEDLSVTPALFSRPMRPRPHAENLNETAAPTAEMPPAEPPRHGGGQ
jgi:hypothetical protein